MDAKDIMGASQLDILFDGKNKAYGAYELRKTYHKRIEYAMVGTGLLVLLFVGSTMLSHKKAAIPAHVMEVTPVHIEAYKKQQKPKVIPPPPRAKAAPKIEMQRLAIPKIVADKLVKPEDLPPKQTDKIKVGPVTQHGMNLDGMMAAPPEVKGVGDNGKGPGGAGTGDNTDYTREFRSVQIEAQYPGGPAAWKKYLERSLRSQVAVDNGASTGLYTVVVSFLVAIDGSTSEIKVLSAPSPDYGTAEEAMRVIQRSGKWTPAIQNGRSVIYREKQKITFNVSE